MRRFKVEMAYRSRAGRNTVTKEIEQVVETDDIVQWIKDNHIGSGFTYFVGKRNAWLRSAEEITDSDEYISVDVDLTSFFGGNFIVRKISRAKVSEAQRMLEKANKMLKEAYQGQVIKTW